MQQKHLQNQKNPSQPKDLPALGVCDGGTVIGVVVGIHVEAVALVSEGNGTRRRLEVFHRHQNLQRFL